jgi:SHS2 domain-containing protein
VRAGAPEDLFRDAMRGMYAVMRGSNGTTHVTRTIAVDDSADTTSLLVDFLNEVLHSAHVDKQMFDDVTFKRFEETSLTAEVTGTAPAEFEEDVKAVTYHEAEVRFVDGGWETMLVFDL